MVILSFDIGIKNLAYCTLCKDTQNIKQWGILNISCDEVCTHISSKGISFSECINCEFLHPAFFATSTNLTEFDEFRLPTTKNISHFEAIFFTADCLFVVA